MLKELWREAQRLHEAFNVMQNGQDSYRCSQTEHCHGFPTPMSDAERIECKDDDAGRQ